MARGWRDAVERFTRWRSARGNVALTFAIAAPVLILLGGGVTDLVNVSMRQSQLQQSVDASAVAAIARDSQAYQAALIMPADGPIAAPGMDAAARSVFVANLKTSNDVTFSAYTVSAQKTGLVISSTVQATETYRPAFLGLAGIGSVPLQASAVARNNLPNYINYYILVDVSQSMGIASTSADMSALYSRIAAYNNGSSGEQGCVFGCHVQAPSNYGGLQPYTNEYLAHNVSPRISLRIDAAVTAIKNIVAQAQTAAGGAANIKIGLYTMSADPVSHQLVNVISPPSSNYAALSTLANNIDLGNNVSGGDGDSDFYDQINYFVANYLGANGNGRDASTPLNYVFLVTDGFVDAMPSAGVSGAPCTYATHCVRAFDSNYCGGLKTNATVGVIYTTYNPIYANNNPPAYQGAYNALVRPYAPSLVPNLTNCATSPTLYFEASDGPDIDTAMTKLFTSTLITARIGQ